MEVDDLEDETYSPNGRKTSKSDDTRRANHNALERKRRVFQKDKLQELREHVPLVTSDKASMVEILQKATTYIHYLQRVSAQKERELSELRKLNESLMERVRRQANGAPIPWPTEAHQGSLKQEANTHIRPSFASPTATPSQGLISATTDPYPSMSAQKNAPTTHRNSTNYSAEESSTPTYHQHSNATGTYSQYYSGAGDNNTYGTSVGSTYGYAYQDQRSSLPPPTINGPYSGSNSSVPPSSHVSPHVHHSPHMYQYPSSTERSPQYHPYPSYSPSPQYAQSSSYAEGGYWASRPHIPHRGTSPMTPPGSYSSSYGDGKGRALPVPPAPSPYSQLSASSPERVSYLSQSVPQGGYYGDRKRAVKAEDDSAFGRSRKISKSEALEDQQLAAEASLFHSFCESVRRNSMSIAPATQSSGGVFDMDMDDRAKQSYNGDPSLRIDGRSAKIRASSPQIFVQDEDADIEREEGDGARNMCYCGRDWDGKMMIMCDRCQRWLHGACAGVQGRHRPSMFVCQQCKAAAS